MKLIESKLLKKVSIGILPLAFLFVTMCPNHIAHSAVPTTVSVLPDAADGALTAITNGQSRDYATMGGYKDSTGAVGAGRGTISYSTAGGTGVLTLNGVDLSTDNGLLTAAAGDGDLEIVLVGTNSITSTKATIAATSNNIKFTGDGTLTISQNTAGSAISTATGGNIEFASNSGITLKQAAVAAAIDSVADLVLTNGHVVVTQTGATDAVKVGDNTTINGGTLDVTQNTTNASIKGTGTLDMTAGSVVTKNAGATGNGTDITGAVTLNGGSIDATITNASSTGIPLYSAETITINSANVKALGAAGHSPYGISNAAGKNITINKGSVIEALGNTNAIRTANLTLDETVAWTALAGQTANAATKLTQTKGSEIVSALTAGGQDYVKLYNETTLDPVSSTFDKYTAAKEHTEITVGLGLNGNTLSEITAGDTALQVGRDYVLNYNGADPVSVTFQVREYLETLPVGEHVLTFKFANGTTADFMLNVVDTTPVNNAEQNQKDQLPKTGDETSVMPYVLLLTAGLFTIIVATKKKIFCK
ncbi:predicted cell wall binding protein [Clostridium sp. CAG:557]|nr:predicted cell wall binding protein [Clostridium sp. CAG:557]